MRQIAIFNNKGGAGKSTFTVFLADFFSSLHFKASKRAVRVLVIDADAQGSAGISLVGRERVAEAIRQHRTLADLLQSEQPSLDEFLLRRPEVETETRRVKLAAVDVIPTDLASTEALEGLDGPLVLQAIAKRLPKLLKDRYDLVLVDLPANVKRRDHLPMALLAASQFVVVPTEPSDIAVAALPRTFEIIRDASARASQLRGLRGPKPLGIVLNKTNRTYKSYKLHIGEIRQVAADAGTSVLENVLPVASQLMTATDSTLAFATLREKFDSYYDHVRKVTGELQRRIQEAEKG